MPELNLVEYTDYRHYLRDYYSRQKDGGTSFSFRVFAMRAKLSSPNYLKLVIDGDRRITDKNLPNFIRGLKLGKVEAEYFRNLVFFQEAEDADAKAMHLKELLRLRTRMGRDLRTLDKDRIDILRSWHPWVIREMISLEDFKPDPEWIAKRLRYKITPTEAGEALALLERLEFVKKSERGYILSDPIISTGDEISTLLLKALHRQFFEFAIQSILNDRSDEREISGVTLAVNKNQIPEVKAAIRDFSKELSKRFSQSEGNDSIYHLALACFPLTQGGSKT